MSNLAIRDEVDHLSQRQSEITARSRDARRGEAPDPARLVEAQTTFDAAYRSLGGFAPPPLRNEGEATYEARLASGLKRFSPAWQDADLYALSPTAGGEAARTIRDDVARAVADPARGDFADSTKLRRVEIVDPDSGQRSIQWHGDPASWMRPMMPEYQLLKSVRDADGKSTPPVLRWIGQ